MRRAHRVQTLLGLGLLFGIGWGIAGGTPVARGEDYASLLAAQAENRRGGSPPLFDERAWPTLIEYACGRDPVLQSEARQTLRWIGPRCADVLLEAYRDGDAPRRKTIGKLLREMAGRVFSEASPADDKSSREMAKETTEVSRQRWRQLLNDPEPELRDCVVRALGKSEFFEEVKPEELRALLANQDEYCRQDAIEILGKKASTQPVATLPYLVEALSDPSPVVRQKSFEICIKLGDGAKEAIPALVQATLAGVETSVRSNMWRDLQKLAEKAVGEMALAVGDANPQRARIAALLLLEMEDATKVPEFALVALATAQKGNVPEVARVATVALGLRAPERVEIDKLRAALSDQEYVVRAGAARQLGLRGAEAAAAVPELTALATNREEEARLVARLALAEIGPARDVILCEALIAESDTEMRIRYLEELNKIPEPSPLVIETLVTALRDRIGAIREGAAQALTRLRGRIPVVSLTEALRFKLEDKKYLMPLIDPAGPIPKEQLDALVGILTGVESYQSASAAQEVLIAAGSQALPAVREGLENLPAQNQARAIEPLCAVLVKLGKEASLAIPELVQLASLNEDVSTRRAALSCLASIGDEAVKALAGRLQTGDEAHVRRVALTLAALDEANGRTAIEPLALAAAASTGEGSRACAVTLAKLAPQRAQAADLLRVFITDSDKDLRMQAADLIEKMGKVPAQASSALAPFLKHKDADRRLAAARILSVHAPLTPGLTKALRDLLQSEDDYSEAGAALLSLASDGSALIALLNDPDKQVRSHAISVLKEHEVSAATPALMKMIGAKKNADLQSEVIDALDALDDEGLSAELLATTAPDWHGDERWSIDSALPNICARVKGDEAVRRTVQALSKGLRQKDPEDAQAVVEALGKMGPAAVSTIPELLSLRQRSGSDLSEEIEGAISEMEDAGLKRLLEQTVAADRALADLAAATLQGVLKKTEDAAKEDAVETLSKMLEAPSERNREIAASGLGSWDKVPATATARLVAALQDESPAVRAAAATSLGKMEADDPGALKAIVASLGDDDELVVQAASQTLQNIDSLDDSILQALADSAKSPKSSMRRAALVIMSKSAHDFSGLPALLVGALKDSSPPVRIVAARAIARRGGSNYELTVPTLLNILRNDPDDDASRAAALALGKIGGPATQALIAELQEGEQRTARVRLHAIAGAATAGRSPALDEALATVARDRNPVLVREAIAALGRPRADAALAVPVLIEAVKSESRADVRIAAFESLGNLGRRARSATSPIVLCLTDASAEIRRAAAESLGAIGPSAQSAGPALLKKLKDQDRAVRASAALALREFGPTIDTDESLLALVAALEDSDAVVRHNVCGALGAFGPKAASAEARLRKLAKNPVDEPFALCAINRISGRGSFPRVQKFGLVHSSGGGWGRMMSFQSALPLLGSIPSPSAHSAFGQNWLNSAAKTLGDVFDRLDGALAYKGYPRSTFYTPGGFAIVSAVEAADDGWKPRPEPDRFPEGRVALSFAHFDFKQYLARLFLGKPDRCRLFVFVVSDTALRFDEKPIRVNAGRAWVGGGGSGIPREVRGTMFEGRQVFALVYSFDDRGDNSKAHVSLSVEEHLVRSGLLETIRAGLCP